MTDYSLKEAQALMNQWGAGARPFLFMIDFEMERNVLVPLDAIDPNQLLFSFSGKGNHSWSPNFKKEVRFFEREPVSFARYKEAFNLVQEEIHSGNSYLLNLTFPTKVHTNLSLKDIFLLNQARYRIWWKDQFTVFSPEPFVEIKYGIISSFPMKGTIEADLPLAEEQLLQNAKEKAEHATIVDLIRNDLGRVAKQVKVEKYRYLDRIATNSGTLLQTSSHISGVLPENYSSQIGDILYGLLPAGSISGAPKKKTVEIIKAAEGYQRGFYTGICGVFDGQNLDSGVMIRFMEKDNNELVFKSGGGITAQSKVQEEYEEMIQKVYLPFALKQEVLL